MIVTFRRLDRPDALACQGAPVGCVLHAPGVPGDQLPATRLLEVADRNDRITRSNAGRPGVAGRADGDDVMGVCLIEGDTRVRDSSHGDRGGRQAGDQGANGEGRQRCSLNLVPEPRRSQPGKTLSPTKGFAGYRDAESRHSVLKGTERGGQ